MDSQYLVLLITFLISISVYFFSIIKSSKDNQKRTSNVLDDYKCYPILGHLPDFIRNRDRYNQWVTDLLNATPTNTIDFHRPFDHGIFTADPTNVEYMLKTNFDNYPKGQYFTTVLRDMFGDGFFNANGDIWKVQRNMAFHEFNTRSLRSFVFETVKMETGTRLLPLLKKYADNGQVVKLQDVLEYYTFDNVCKVAFNVDPACLTEEVMQHSASEGYRFAKAFEEGAEISVQRFRYAVPNFWKIVKLCGIGSERRLKNSIGTVHEFANKVIRSRMNEMKTSSSSNIKPRADDLVSRFILADENYTEDFLRDMVISFILAGRDTSSTALTWFFWILSYNPEVQNKILEEIASIRAQSDNPVSKKYFEFEDLKKMQYLHAAITESMRLYPPVPQDQMECLKDEILPDGTKIKKGWFMAYNNYAMGRTEKIWGKDCLEYKPERWLDDSGMFRPESQFKFVQFHAGPRMCLGKETAYIQMKSIAASVIDKFVVEMVEKDTEPEIVNTLTLKMRKGLPVRIRNRD